MKIVSNPKIVNLSNHPFIKETRYCFCSINQNNKDVYDLEPKLDFEKDRVTSLWTAKELEEFRIKDNTHSYLKQLEQEIHVDKVKNLNKLIRSRRQGLKTYKNHESLVRRFKIDILNFEAEIERLNSSIIIFVQINLVD